MITTPDGLVLEGAWSPPDGDAIGCVVFCHPHPLDGGTMNAPLLQLGAATLAEAGLWTLRFNFRGVGHSEGVHDHGQGEQDDVRIALDEMDRRFPGLPLVLGGFSFGSVMALKVGAADSRIRALFALGYPARLVPDLSFLATVHLGRIGKLDR